HKQSTTKGTCKKSGMKQLVSLILVAGLVADARGVSPWDRFGQMSPLRPIMKGTFEAQALAPVLTASGRSRAIGAASSACAVHALLLKVGLRVRTHRVNRGWEVEHLAKLAKTSVKSVIHLENAQRRVPVTVCLRVASVLNIHLGG